MENKKFFSYLTAGFLVVYSPSSEAGLFDSIFDAIFTGVGQMGQSNNGNRNNNNGNSNNNSNGNNNGSSNNNGNGNGNNIGNGFGTGMNGGPGVIGNNNNNNSVNTGTQISPGSPNGNGVATVQNVIVVASNPGMIPIPRCSAGTFKNLKFPRYSAGTAQAMPANARTESFAADLPSGADGTRTTIACSTAISSQPRSMDGNNYNVQGDLQFACISGSWMLENSDCHAVIVPPAAFLNAGAGGTPTTTGQTLNGVTCPAGSTPRANSAGGYGTSVTCVSSAVGGYGNQTVPACGANIYGNQAGC